MKMETETEMGTQTLSRRLSPNVVSTQWLVLKLLGITTLHNGMILSTLSISSHGFTFGFPKRSRTNGDVFLTYKSMTIP